MARRLLIAGGVVAVLMVVLIIAIAVPLSMKNSDDSNDNNRQDTSGLPPLERAKIILGRVPLVDGYVLIKYVILFFWGGNGVFFRNKVYRDKRIFKFWWYREVICLYQYDF